jgi:hypothetical protein
MSYTNSQGETSDPPKQFKQSKINMIVLENYYSPEMCREHIDWLFVFGDNLLRKGTGGQACIRGIRNSMGIPTKNAPSWEPRAYFSDEAFESQKKAIDESIEAIVKYYWLNEYECLVMPKEGLGTGFAYLKSKSPETWRYLCKQLLLKFGFDNKKGKLIPPQHLK